MAFSRMNGSVKSLVLPLALLLSAGTQLVGAQRQNLRGEAVAGVDAATNSSDQAADTTATAESLQKATNSSTEDLAPSATAAAQGTAAAIHEEVSTSPAACQPRDAWCYNNEMCCSGKCAPVEIRSGSCL